MQAIWLEGPVATNHFAAMSYTEYERFLLGEKLIRAIEGLEDEDDDESPPEWYRCNSRGGPTRRVRGGPSQRNGLRGAAARRLPLGVLRRIQNPSNRPRLGRLALRC